MMIKPTVLLFLLSLLFVSLQANAKPHEREWYEPERVFGGQVYLRTAGNPNKPAVVMVHGLGDEASTCWEDILQRLKKDYFIFTFDLPGFGRSTKQNALYSPVNYARLIHQLTDKHVGKPFHLVGHSMGGAISLQFTHSYPAAVKTLTLISAAGILHRQAYTKYLAPLGVDKVLNQYNVFNERKVTDLAGTLMSALEKRYPVNMDLLINLEPFRNKVLRGDPSAIAGLALVQNDFSRIPETVHQPTLIVWGEQDKIAPVRTGYVLESLMPDARLELIPNGGHVAFIDQPELFHDMLRPHLSQSTKTKAKSSTKQATPPFRQTVQCNSESGHVISGRIGSLLIQSCEDVVVQDAEINNIVIIDSNVSLRNTRVISVGTALKTRNSNVTITGGHLEGEVAIEANNSRLDIAGTQLVGHQAAVKAPQDSTLIFSLGRIDSPLYDDLVIHGMKVVAPGSYL
ncbi:MAG: alpha/beta hydrolase [Candidatus Thiodiazotropha taylori]|nr:alpha/beta hydrolase [Candidatus Thiodiazotropha taylori]